MIFENHRVIYFHPGKTAGTAVEAAFGYTNQTHDPAVKNMAVFKGWDTSHNLYLQHAPAAFMHQHIAPETWARCFKFVTVRNPFNRLVSAYYFNRKVYEPLFGDFTEFILSLQEILHREPYPSGRHYVPLVDYAFVEGECVVDFVVRFERVARDLEKLGQHLGMKLRLQQVNTARGEGRPAVPADQLYSPAMVDVMRSVYAQDFEYFGYPLDPPGPGHPESPSRGQALNAKQVWIPPCVSGGAGNPPVE